jgi:hypothetical protein|tara:strand:+ start:923 stop:1474 length:552 start_codon:yes stop_codon:yes gene_type:complete
MGVHDRRRFPAFADFIHNTYRQATTVADVAGGRGILSYHLHQLGYDATIIDTRNAHLPSRLQRVLRKQSVKQGRLIEIPRVIGKVQEVDLRPFDIIVGLHPDDATEHLVREALKLGKDFAVIPCCVFPIDGAKHSQEDWRAYLASLSADMRTATLPIDGANTVLYRCTAASIHRIEFPRCTTH